MAIFNEKMDFPLLTQFGWFATMFQGDLDSAGLISPPHSNNIHKSRTIRVKDNFSGQSVFECSTLPMA